ncbi:hypothetical protein ACX801_16625 [Arthrobacter bambusae]|uniref:hypothetical protein n=1 Tax=Arthrobacter sp. efr-133-R2A-120 TaxID=3040277 RepID=UPI002550E284|nr:hypothetical protein [Arthrobacter sp. efr-133-R2A-120]
MDHQEGADVSAEMDHPTLNWQGNPEQDAGSEELMSAPWLGLHYRIEPVWTARPAQL